MIINILLFAQRIERERDRKGQREKNMIFLERKRETLIIRGRKSAVLFDVRKM